VGRASTLVADGGDTLTWALAYADAEGPGRLLSTTQHLNARRRSALRLAAKVARPDEPVVLVTGDGAFGLSAMEMDTAARHHLPIIVVVANNCGWGDVRHHQREMYHREVASALADTRYDRLAEALGATASGSSSSPICVPHSSARRAPAARADRRAHRSDVLSALLRAMMMVGIM